MKFILGRKLKMTQLFLADGKVASVTAIEAGPCQVTQVKTKTTDGYKAVQIGFGKKNKLSKALLGHLKNYSQYRFLKEFRLEDGQEVKPGQLITVATFAEGDSLKVTGTSIGRGFQGVAGGLQHRRQHIAKEGGIVDEQDPAPARRAVHFGML